MTGKSMLDLMREEHELRVKWMIRRNLFLLACVGIAAGSFFYIAVLK